jgi:flagellar motor switch protein FliM
VDVPDTVVLCAEKVPVLRGIFGVSNGSNAVKITGRVKPWS